MRFLNFLKKQEANGNYFTKAMNIGVTSEDEVKE